MDVILGIIQALMALFGYVEEQRATRDLCEQMWAAGYVVLPPSETDQKRAKECVELHDGR